MRSLVTTWNAASNWAMWTSSCLVSAGPEQRQDRGAIGVPPWGTDLNTDGEGRPGWLGGEELGGALPWE